MCLLGRWRLHHAAEPHDIVISSKKARALLAYVAMQEPMRLDRERLATLLWPDRVDRQARQNLRKCLASLRHDLAPWADELLVVDNQTIGIGHGLVVDARRLRTLAATDPSADLDEAAALYRGQFLADVPTGGEDFGNWALAERAQLDAAAGTILSQLASRADAAGDARKALQVSSQLIAIDPYREDWLRLSLRITARHRGRDQALLQARRFAALLRKELDVEPDVETAALMAQIKAGRIAPVSKPDAAAIEVIGRPQPLPSRWPVLANRDGRPVMVSAVIAAVTALLVAASFAHRPSAEKTTAADTAGIDPSTISLLVRPLQSETSETVQLAGTLTDSLLTAVSRFSGLTVFDGRPAVESHGIDRPGIRFSTWGSVQRQGATVRLNIGLTDVASQALLWATDINASDDRFAALQAELPKRLARELQVHATYAQARGADGKPLHEATSSELIAKALTVQYRGAMPDNAAAALYEEVLRRDRNCALALVGLAAGLATSSANLFSERQSTLARAETLINQALQIDPLIERAHYWLGIVYLGRGQRDLALQSFDRALALNPSFVPAEAHAGYALVLLGRTAEGLQRIENALGANSHDPSEHVWLRFAGIAELELGNDRRAIDAFLQAGALAVPTPPLHAALASAYALTGQRAESREQFRLMQQMIDSAALDRLLKTAAREDGQRQSRYWQGLRLAASDTL